MTIAVQRRFPIGAEFIPGGGVHFRVWAPRRAQVDVVVENADAAPLEKEEGGYFSGLIEGVPSGATYQFQLDRKSPIYPDPASRFQPLGPHGPSQVVDARYPWTDEGWTGVRRHGQVVYEMHIGTFTEEGTWAGAQQELPHLADLGVTLIEIMPIAEFPGNFGWGYDGVDLFAPSHLYGSPNDFRTLVNEAHRLGIGVVLDVVYNHFGPDGNYLKEFALSYFSKKYTTEWGEALNFDGADSLPVREFIVANACYWIDEFHVDGIRLDATQQMFDASREHIVAELTRGARLAAHGRSILVIGENETQRAIMLRSPKTGGYGLDCLWNDDFHHSAHVAATGRSEAYYTDYRGRPQEFISSLKWGFLYQGQYHSWQKQSRGAPAFDIDPAAFVVYLQNHDQVANSAYGQRLHELTHPGLYRALTALLLLAPGTPMLFQGQEFAASSPFYYFADHKPALAELVQAGRQGFLTQFQSIAWACTSYQLPPPHDQKTFLACKLNRAERDTHEKAVRLHQDLLRLRREDPIFSKQRTDWLHGAVIGSDAFVLRFFGNGGDDRLLVVNLGPDVPPQSIPEPLLTPPEQRQWELLWSSESSDYGGCAAPPVDESNIWRIYSYSAAVLTAVAAASEVRP